ncbi:hypothetical protein KC19_2G213500 [Ceratodon purpureus]|uniref:Uncharacterized protein n=1 Tax=Ceratodon purpureus TaxID=3225 RepID=A0A8T0IYT8_CERPU|nr:hypothetical protein KC19_2G213500 [Ceratodon purpureus]
MAELASPSSKKSLWPTLKKKLVEAKNKTTRRKPKKQNPFASQGLEKFALMMAELQAKKASLVDKTGNSVSAVRYLSRSAQEWTATTLARTASRRREKVDLSPKSSEVLLLQQSPPEAGSHSNSTVEIETIGLSQSFSFPDPGHGFGFDSEVLAVGDLQREMNSDASVSHEGDAAAEESREPPREPIREDEKQEEAGCSRKTAALPARSAKLIRNGRLLLLEKSWSRSPSSAFALLVALGACLSGRLTKLGNSILELLSINFAARWQKGKVWADFLQAAVARHVVPHLSIRVPRGLPRGLGLLPLVRRKISPEPQADRCDSVARVEAQSEIEPVEKPNLNIFTFPVVPENTSFSSADFPALATLQFQAETSDSSSSSSSIRTSSSTRRFVKKLSSKLKAKISKSGSSVPGSPISESASSSRRRSSKFSFSRRDKEKDMSDDGWPDEEEIFAESSKKRSILKKKCSFRKDRTPEPSTNRRSPLGRNFAMEPLSSTDITSGLHDQPANSIFDAGHKNFDLWMIVGLLVALVFLLVSRFSAVVAMSSLFLVLSYAHKEISFYRVPRRDIDINGRQSVETARRLHRNTDYGGRLGSPSREEAPSSCRY